MPLCNNWPVTPGQSGRPRKLPAPETADLFKPNDIGLVLEIRVRCAKRRVGFLRVAASSNSAGSVVAQSNLSVNRSAECVKEVFGVFYELM